eukprot:1157535-Pelagomonas_calceolata.AAC.4
MQASADTILPESLDGEQVNPHYLGGRLGLEEAAMAAVELPRFLLTHVKKSPCREEFPVH